MANQNQEIQFTKLFINNRFVDAKSGKTYTTYNPATGKVLAQIAEGDKYDVDYAVECAKKAFDWNSEWRKMDASHRGYLLYKLADLMELHLDTIINLETLDHGCPRDMVRDNVYFAIKTIRYYAGYADKMHGKTIPCDGDYMSFTRLEPYGVVGQMIPNYNPIIMFAWKLAPALATGNCLVMKLAEQTPLSALYIASLIKEVGFPDGVVNILTGNGQHVGRYIVNHQDIRKIVFSGKTKNGRDVMENAAHNYLKNVSLNLSANNPLIVFRDYDLNDAVQIAHDNLFYNQGLNSCSAHRVYVQEDIYDDFVRRSVELARKRKIGSPFDQDTLHGPMVDENQMTKILSFIESTKKEGGRLEYGGKRHGSQGYYIEPTVFSHCMDNMRCATEDLYGPVQYIFKFKNYDEMIQRANHCQYGKASGVLTHNLDYALKFIQRLEYGSVWINDFQLVRPQTPYGGHKLSGFDQELGYNGLHMYLQQKTVTLKTQNKF